MSESTSGEQHHRLDPVAVDKLLQLLGSDDEFRALFERDPSSALKQCGVEVAPDQVPACLTVGTLASKQELQQARELIQQHLLSMGTYYNPHCLEAGQVSSTLKGE